MKPTGPVLVGMVVGLIAFSMNNNSSADEPDGSDRSTGDSSSSDSESSDDSGTQGADDDESGASGDGRGDADGSGEASGSTADFPDTGGADVPELPGLQEGEAVVTLTFDDGPHPTYTPQVLDMLAAREATAVFCVVGENARKHPELVRRIVDEGHVLCNHSYSHDTELDDRPAETVEKEVVDTADAIARAAPGVDVRFFRQPARYVTPEVATVAAAQGLAPLDWTVDPRDWKEPKASTITRRVLSEVHPGAVVLLHDGGGDRSETVKALAQLLLALEAAGYEMVVPEPS